MYTELIPGTVIRATAFDAFVTPRLERRRQRALVDIN